MAHLRRGRTGSSLRRTRAYASVVAAPAPCIWTILDSLTK
jgi:hypothetical protein